MRRPPDRCLTGHRMRPVLALALSLLACACSAGAGAAAGESDERLSVSGMQIVGPPTEPPARICGNAAVLDGPAAAPAGSVPVAPGENVQDLTDRHPAGTTFWLAPGTHAFDYSVVPKDGNVYVGAPGAIVDGGDTTAIAFWEEGFEGGRRVENVELRNLTIQNFTSNQEDQGSVYAGVGWRILNSTFRGHGFVALFAGPNNVIRENCFADNGQLAIGTYRIDGNAHDITIDRNEFTNNNTRNLQDCGCGGGVKFWAVQRAQFTNNWVHDNRGTGVWADNNNVEILFDGNFVNDNDAVGVFYEISYNFMIRNNSFIRNAIVEGARKDDNFPVAAVYISESGGVAIPGFQYAVAEVYHNYFEDNWDGVALWESGNRYTGTDGDGYAPAYGDPNHWKTQNVAVHDNEFRMNKAEAGCEGNRNCGRNGLFSDWVPVPGPVLAPNSTNSQYQISVSFDQNNTFHDNRYQGEWAFVGFDQGSLYDWTTWRNPKPSPLSSFDYEAPGQAGFGQDVGSTMN